MSVISKMIPEKYKGQFRYLVLDIIIINFALLASVGLWYDGSIPGGIRSIVPEQVWDWFAYAAIIAPIVKISVFSIFKFYSKLWKYSASDELIKVIIVETIVFVLIFAVDYFFLRSIGLVIIPKRLFTVAWALDLVLFVFSRFAYRLIKRSSIYLGHILSRKTRNKRVMIIGAGYAGFSVIRSIKNNERGFEDRLPIIIVDDDEKKHNTNIHGVRVIKGVDDVLLLSELYEIEEIIIAIPTASNIQLKRILDNCNQTNCALKMIPPISDVSDGMKNNLRDVKISDLLFRDEVNIDVNSISGYLKNNNILVTGGGGSIGSELCRQIAGFSPSKLVIFDIYENNAYELMNELKRKYPELNIIIRIGSVRDLERVEAVFEEFKPSVIFHAAAHKHVSLMQESPGEAVKNNVFGTMNVAKCADKFGAERFVLLSTDKAVNPTNIMGATKRVTELIIQQIAAVSKTKYMAVRFGNVLGSNGSVIPLFQKQIEQGGPVTVTHPEVTRYFMTIPEASKLVLQAAGIGKSGKIFVLDMGEPVKINDLARNLIKLSGYAPDKDIKIEYVGLRPGEKLYEELILNEEKEELKVTYHNKIFVAKPTEIDDEKFNSQLASLYDAAVNNPQKVYEILSEILPNYKNQDNIGVLKNRKF